MRATPEEVEEILSFPTCTVEQAASVLGVGRGHAYRAVKAGEIPAIHMPTTTPELHTSVESWFGSSGSTVTRRRGQTGPHQRRQKRSNP